MSELTFNLETSINEHPGRPGAARAEQKQHTS